MFIIPTRQTMSSIFMEMANCFTIDHLLLTIYDLRFMIFSVVNNK